MKLEKSLNGMVPALCYNNLFFFVTSLERHKVSVHISDLFNLLNFFRLLMNIKNYIKIVLFFFLQQAFSQYKTIARNYQFIFG